MKFCENCKKEKTDTDFYKENICYRCQYRQKVQAQKTKTKLCKICYNPLGKGKSAYCSDKCLYVAKTIHNHTYWLRKCTAPKISWKS